MTTKPRFTSAAAFDRFVRQPENADRHFEYIAGEIVEVVLNGYSSEIGAYLCGLIAVFAREHKLGRVTGADGGYEIGSERYIPHCAFIRLERQAHAWREGYNPTPPDLAVEVLSTSNTPEEIATKVVNYLSVGCTVWVVNPVTQRVVVYSPNQPTRILGVDDVLDGGEILPHFAVPVKALFED